MSLQQAVLDIADDIDKELENWKGSSDHILVVRLTLQNVSKQLRTAVKASESEKPQETIKYDKDLALAQEAKLKEAARAEFRGKVPKVGGKDSIEDRRMVPIEGTDDIIAIPESLEEGETISLGGGNYRLTGGMLRKALLQS